MRQFELSELYASALQEEAPATPELTRTPSSVTARMAALKTSPAPSETPSTPPPDLPSPAGDTTNSVRVRDGAGLGEVQRRPPCSKRISAAGFGCLMRHNGVRHSSQEDRRRAGMKPCPALPLPRRWQCIMPTSGAHCAAGQGADRRHAAHLGDAFGRQPPAAVAIAHAPLERQHHSHLTSWPAGIRFAVSN